MVKFLVSLGQLILVAGVGLFVYWSQVQVNQEPVVSHYLPTRPLDKLTSVRSAFSLANLARFNETGWLEDQAQATAHLTYLPASPDLVAAKPLVVNLSARTRADIGLYTPTSPETIASLAYRYLVSENSIRWSNGLSGNLVPAGQTILVPPSGLNGIVYEVAAQDTIEKLVEHYEFEVEQLIIFNDIVDNQLPIGELIFIPNGRPKLKFRQLPSALSYAITGSFNQEVIGITPGCHGCRPVAAGEVVGKIGNTGWSTGPHLHIEIYNDQGHRFNPEVYIHRQGLVWPVQGWVSQRYSISHPALDIATQEGTPLVSVAPGTIIHRGCLWLGHPRFATFGVIVDHASWYSMYIHLQAPNNTKYEGCNKNLRTSYGTKSIDYQTLE